MATRNTDYNAVTSEKS